jgi:hypothetical protein
MTSPFDGPPDSWPDKIVFVSDGSAPPRWHVSDQEALARALPPCPVKPAAHAGLAPVRLRVYPATIWLPASGRSEDTEVPDPESIEGWDWPSDDGLYLMIGTRRDLPRLRSLGYYGPDDCHALLAGRPVAVTRYAEPLENGEVCHRAVVGGYLDDRTTLHVDVIASTQERRDALVAALLTLTPDPGAPRA